MNMTVPELMCISVWHYAPLKNKRRTVLFMMLKSINGWHVHY